MMKWIILACLVALIVRLFLPVPGIEHAISVGFVALLSAFNTYADSKSDVMPLDQAVKLDLQMMKDTLMTLKLGRTILHK